MSKSISVYVGHIDVDVDLADFDTDDLVAEIASRAANGESETPSLGSETPHPLHEIYYAFKFNLSDRATELMRAYVCDQLGVIL